MLGWVPEIPWAKIVYSIVLVSVAILLLLEAKRLWWDTKLYIGSFSVLSDDGNAASDESDMATRVAFWHRDLRHHFNHSVETKFAAESALRPDVSAPIEQPSSVLSEISITVQKVDVTDILGKLRKWVSKPREITGIVTHANNEYRATVQIDDNAINISTLEQMAPTVHFGSASSKDALGFNIACRLIWRQAAQKQKEIADADPQEFCDWSNAWIGYLRLRQKSGRLEGLAKADIEVLNLLRTHISDTIEQPDSYLPFLNLRASVAQLLHKHETDQTKKRNLIEQILSDRFKYLVRLRVDPASNVDLNAVRSSTQTMKIFAGMRPALVITGGKLDFTHLSMLDKDLGGTKFSETWQNILASAKESIETSATAMGVVKIGRTGKVDNERGQIGFAIGKNLVYAMLYTVDNRLRTTTGLRTIDFTTDSQWDAKFWFTDMLDPPPTGFSQVKRAILFETNSLRTHALIEIETHDPSKNTPIIFDPASIVKTQAGSYIAALGYPTADENVPDDLVPQVLGKDHGIKRVAPGRLLSLPDVNGEKPSDTIRFEAMTMEGTGGGPLLNLHNGRLIGVNFASQYERTGDKQGTAIPLAEVLEIDAVRKIFEKTAGASIMFDEVQMVVLAEMERRKVANKSQVVSVEIPASANIIERMEAFGTLGYDPMFLSTKLELPKVLEGPTVSPLDYLHYTVQLNPERRLAWYAIANVDASQSRRSERSGRFLPDPRLPETQQISRDATRNSQLDRGHLLSRQYIDWGTAIGLAKEASDGAFLFPNIAPQSGALNRQMWRKLEQFILDHIQTSASKATVISGPVLRMKDPVFNDFQIPKDFWKILVTTDHDGSLRASGFMISNYLKIKDGKIEDASTRVQSEFHPHIFEIPIDRIEFLTGLDFGPLRTAESALSR